LGRRTAFFDNKEFLNELQSTKLWMRLGAQIEPQKC